MEDQAGDSLFVDFEELKIHRKASIYYDPVKNPYGAPPQGQVLMYRHPDGSVKREPPELPSGASAAQLTQGLVPGHGDMVLPHQRPMQEEDDGESGESEDEEDDEEDDEPMLPSELPDGTALPSEPSSPPPEPGLPPLPPGPPPLAALPPMPPGPPPGCGGFGGSHRLACSSDPVYITFSCSFLFVTPVISAAILARSRHPRAVTTVRGSDGDGTGRVASWLSPGFCRGGRWCSGAKRTDRAASVFLGEGADLWRCADQWLHSAGESVPVALGEPEL
eukprot:symbB.v1.2.022543.t1/scaffold2009.1/size92556/2